MINLIFACDKNFLIGNGDKIPWHYKEDLLYYKSMTNGKNVLMGDKTYYSLKSYYKDKPLPYGKIYVASLDNLVLDDAILVSDIDSFLNSFNDELWVVGGAMIYKLSLPYANRLYITHIDREYSGNIYAPKIDFTLFDIISSKKSIEYPELTYVVYERRGN